MTTTTNAPTSNVSAANLSAAQIERLRRSAEMGDTEAQAILDRHKEREQGVTGWQNFRVADSRLKDLEKTMKSLTRLAKRCNRPEPRWQVTGTETVAEAGRLYLYHRVAVVLPPLSLPGSFRHVATVDVNEEGRNVVHRAAGYNGPLPDPNWGICSCDVCDKNRARKRVEVVMNTGTTTVTLNIGGKEKRFAPGQQVRVGTTCINDFFGTNGTQLIRALAFSVTTGQRIKAGSWSHTPGSWGVNHRDFHAYMAAGRNSGSAWSAAASLAMHTHTGGTDSEMAPTSRSWVALNAPTPANYAEADAALLWIGAMNLEADDAPEFEKNMQGASTFPVLEQKHIRIVRSLIRRWRTATAPAPAPQPRYAIARLRWSDKERCDIYTLTTPHRHREFISEFRQEVGFKNTHWNRDAQRWEFLDRTGGETREAVRRLAEKVWPTPGLELPAAPKTRLPNITTKDGVYIITLPSPSERFFSMALAHIDSARVEAVGKAMFMTRDKDTARNAFRIARWDMNSPADAVQPSKL